jgi:hypothetical protein
MGGSVSFNQSDYLCNTTTLPISITLESEKLFFYETGRDYPYWLYILKNQRKELKSTKRSKRKITQMHRVIT